MDVRYPPMRTPIPIDLAQYSAKANWFMAAAWLVIAIKCGLVAWAFDRWHIPFHPAWIIAPTLVFAGLATILWITHPRDEQR